MDNMAQFEGTITPSFLEHARANAKLADHVRKIPLRVGRVIAAHPPSSDRNLNKMFIEYDVLIEDGSEDRPATRLIIPHCWVASSFGGAADFSRFTPRVIEVDKNELEKDEDFGYGSRVLVMLINGSSFGGVILGGIQHGLGEGDDEEAGHHHVEQFNGVRQVIDKDGQYHVTFSGATNERGELASGVSDANSGTATHFWKDGSWQVHTKDEKQYVKLDHAATSLDIYSEGTFKWECGGASTVDVGGDYTLTCGAASTLASLGAVQIESQTAGIDLIANIGLIKTSSLGVHLGAATDAMVKGTTYRVAETTMHTTQAAAVASMLAIFNTIGGLLHVVSTLHKIPVVGPILGSIPLQGAAAAFNALSAPLGAMQAAITTFEGASPTYLSLKNMLD